MKSISLICESCLPAKIGLLGWSYILHKILLLASLEILYKV